MKQVEFDAQDLGVLLGELTTEQFDKLDFGVIGFDDESLVNVYNACESRMAGLSTQNVLGADLFNTVAPCMNNFLVAQKFQDAIDDATELDEIMDYVLTLKMKPTRVKLRLLSQPQLALNYLVILRSA